MNFTKPQDGECVAAAVETLGTGSRLWAYRWDRQAYRDPVRVYLMDDPAWDGGGLERQLLHEIGHALGLSHSLHKIHGASGKENLMAREDGGGTELSPHDTARVKAKYGAGEIDRDGDGYTAGQGDCRDDLSGIHPGAPEILCTDGVDNNCDGLVDTGCPSSG